MLNSHPALRAALWMSGALVSFMAMAISGRELSAELGTFQILFFRSLIGLLVITLLLQRFGWGQVVTQRGWLHGVRNLAHFGGQFGWFYGLAYISLAEVFAIEFTVPIWTALLAVLLLGERLTGARMLAIGFGFAGTLLILRPGIEVVQLAALAVLGGALGYALTHIMTKKLAPTETPLTILFYMTIMQLPLGLLPSLGSWVTPSSDMVPWLLGVGVTALSAHYCLTRALQLADATVVVPMDFLRLPLIALVGFLFYQELLDWWVLAGATLMLVGNLVNIRAESRRT
jgi:drug/metabolite transporter (DMT)-like permease